MVQLIPFAGAISNWEAINMGGKLQKFMMQYTFLIEFLTQAKWGFKILTVPIAIIIVGALWVQPLLYVTALAYIHR